VATPELADALRRAPIDGVEVVCAPTPELDRVIDSLLEHFTGDGAEPQLSYLEGDVTVDGTEAMFRAAARLYRTKPWDVIASDSHLIGITSEPLGLRDAVISVIGQSGKAVGSALRHNPKMQLFCVTTPRSPRPVSHATWIRALALGLALKLAQNP
jgi:hypothetical protein